MVVGEKRLSRNGIRVVVMLRRMAVGKGAGGYDPAVRIRSRKEWFRHKMSKGSWWACQVRLRGW